MSDIAEQIRIEIAKLQGALKALEGDENSQPQYKKNPIPSLTQKRRHPLDRGDKALVKQLDAELAAAREQLKQEKAEQQQVKS